MHPDNLEAIVHRLRDLVDEKPEQAMDELESLVKQRSVRELAEILLAVYVEISGETGIDWHFTALQWKLGSGTRGQALRISREARFTVWSFAFLAESGSGSETRYTTCLPFSFKPEWLPRHAKAARTTTTLIKLLFLENTRQGRKTGGNGGRYRI